MDWNRQDMENMSATDSLYMLQTLYDKDANHLAMLKKQVNEIHEEQGKILNLMIRFFFMKYDEELSFKKDQVEVRVCFLFNDGTKVTVVSNAQYIISGIESEMEEDNLPSSVVRSIDPITVKSFLRRLSMEEPKILFVEKTFRNHVVRRTAEDYEE